MTVVFGPAHTHLDYYTRTFYPHQHWHQVTLSPKGEGLGKWGKKSPSGLCLRPHGSLLLY